MPIENDGLTTKSNLKVDFREISLTGSKYYHSVSTPDYNPDELVGRKGLEIYKKMRDDDQVKAVLTMKKFARLMTPWEVQPASQDAMDVEIAEFIKTNFQNLEGTFEDNLLNIFTALDFGFSLTEKIWYRIEKGQFAGKIGLKSLKTREPFYYQFESDNFGNLRKDGIIYCGPGSYENEVKGNDENVIQSLNNYIYGRRLPIDKFVIYSYNREFSNHYGRSDLRGAYRSWWSKELLIRFMNMYMERFGMPTHVAKVPKSMSKPDKEKLQVVLDRVQSKYSIVITEDVAIELLNAGTGGEGSFRESIEMHNKFISRSILVPDLMGFNTMSGGGSYALGKKHFDVFLWILQKLGRDLEETVIGEQIIKQLVDYNYSNVEDYPKFKFESITAEGTATRANIIQMGVAGGFINPEEEWIREYLALPKADPSKPLGMPKEQLPGGLGMVPEKIESEEGIKSAEDIKQDGLKSEEEPKEFRVSLEYLEACKNWSYKNRKYSKSNLVDINKIKPNPEQNKIIDGNKVQSMVTTLQRGEELSPIEVDKDYNLINGHHRLMAYKQAGRKEIPIEIVDKQREVKAFKKSDKLPQDDRFDYKIDYKQMEEDLDEYESDTVDSLSKIIKEQKDALLKSIEKKRIIEDKDYTAVDNLQLKFVGDFKKDIEQRLIKLYLDSKLEMIRELAKGSDGQIQVVTKFADVTIQNWIPVPPTEAIEFFNRKVLAKIITSEGIKKLIIMATRKELEYYDSKAFAIAGVERDTILKKAKFILLDGLKTGASNKDVMFNLGNMFDEYLVTGELKDEELVTPARLETIVRTNFSEALNAGRKAMFDNPILEDFVPYVKWSAILDSRVRPSHAEMHNKIFKRDDPSIANLPPAGFNCRCLFTGITKTEVQKLIKSGEGIDVSTGDDFPADFPDKGFNTYTDNLDRVIQIQSIKDIVKCPYKGCSALPEDIEWISKDEFDTMTYKCKVCKNQFKITKEKELYLYDKVNNTWIKETLSGIKSEGMVYWRDSVKAWL